MTPGGLYAPAPGLYTCILPLFSKIFFSETAWPINAKFHVEPSWEVGKKVYINGTGHMTKMAANPIMVKTFKNLLLQNQKFYDIETWHIALEAQALQSLYINDDPGLTLTYFTARSNWVTCTLNGKNFTKSFYGGKLAAKDYID